MNTAPVLVRSGTLPLYALSGVAGPGSGYWAGYRPSTDRALGDSATLEQVWQDAGGVYVFVGARPADDAAFSAALDAYLGQASPTGLLRVLWIADATADTDAWQVAAVPARSTGSGTGIAWSVARPAALHTGEYGVALSAGTALAPSPAPLGFGIAAAELTFDGPAASCLSQDGTAWLPLAGPHLGCWRAVLPLPRETAGGDTLAGLRAGLRFAAPHTDGEPGDWVDALDVPVLAQDGARLSLHLAYDWLRPLDATRTRAGFFDEAGTGDPGPALPATLRTVEGHRTTLSPRAHRWPLRPAGLVICATPASVPGHDVAPTGLSYHLAPDGAFDLAVVPPAGQLLDGASARVMPGLSGTEYACLAPSPGATVFFAAGQPAFAPGAGPHGPPAAATSVLTGVATTAHLTFLPPVPGPGLRYCSQPQQAPLHATGTAQVPGALGFLEVPTAALPDWDDAATTAPAVMPAVPLAGVAPTDTPLALRIERSALSPARRRAIDTAPPARPTGGSGSIPAVTPQGLLVEVGVDGIDRLVLAALPDAARPPDRGGRLAVTELAISRVGPRLRRTLQSDELFTVIGDPLVFLADSSVPYGLDEAGLAAARARGVPDAVVEALRTVVMPDGEPLLFPSEAAFDDAVGAVAHTAETLHVLHELAGRLTAVLSDWVFQLSPRAWRTGTTDGTLMLVKYAHRSIADLADDPPAWSWPEAAGLGTPSLLRGIVATARERARAPAMPDDPHATFFHDVLDDPSWNGVLFLNVPVMPAELPAELQFLTAGVDDTRFFAHHLGFAATPAAVDERGSISLRQTAAFGLVDYQDPTDLVLTPGTPNPDFGFKTLALTARFANAALAGFTTRAELMVNRLLGATLLKRDPTCGNNLLLTGTGQRQGDVLSYAFRLEGEHHYDAERTVIDSLQVDTVRMLTSSPANDDDPNSTAEFALGGFLRFRDHPTFDTFGYGPAPGSPDTDGRLRFDDLAIRMRFPLGTTGETQFDSRTDEVRLDPSCSEARARSVVRNFPVSLNGLVGASAQSPAEAGFVPVSTPVDTASAPAGPWWGLSYRIDLGTLGALAGDAPLSMTLLAAWCSGQSEGDEPVWFGLQFPQGKQWPLQGVLTLGFRSFQFLTHPTADDGLAYELRLRGFALRLLGLSLPPGNLDLALFGDRAHPEARVVGWYGAYEKEPSKRPEGGVTW
ncbi:hypothetical protein [[Kitasatospora] papulosa]|uniref:hypothetical protein n=1 Tax=[Kitasatospora] papulosa TaxID=1464011 RepID=UPI0036AED9C0